VLVKIAKSFLAYLHPSRTPSHGYRLYRFLLSFIPVTCRVKGYTKFVGKYVTGRRMRFRPYKVYIFLINITSRIDLAMSVQINAEISETTRTRKLVFRFGELLAQQ